MLFYYYFIKFPNKWDLYKWFLSHDFQRYHRANHVHLMANMLPYAFKISILGFTVSPSCMPNSPCTCTLNFPRSTYSRAHDSVGSIFLYVDYHAFLPRVWTQPRQKHVLSSSCLYDISHPPNCFMYSDWQQSTVWLREGQSTQKYAAREYPPIIMRFSCSLSSKRNFPFIF